MPLTEREEAIIRRITEEKQRIQHEINIIKAKIEGIEYAIKIVEQSHERRKPRKRRLTKPDPTSQA